MALVLVVDDEFGIAELIASILADEGHCVSIAVNGRRALEALAGDRPALMFLDYMMPVMDGSAVLHAMHADPALRDIPVVQMSGIPEDTLAQRCTGYAAVMVKPFRVREVLAVTRRLLAGSASATATPS